MRRWITHRPRQWSCRPAAGAWRRGGRGCWYPYQLPKRGWWDTKRGRTCSLRSRPPPPESSYPSSSSSTTPSLAKPNTSDSDKPFSLGLSNLIRWWAKLKLLGASFYTGRSAAFSASRCRPRFPVFQFFPIQIILKISYFHFNLGVKKNYLKNYCNFLN